jgi:uncharacterized protein YjlB
MKPVVHLLADDGTFPNSVFPALVYKGALGGRDLAAGFEALFARHGWTGSWRNGLYGFHHYHSTAHEVLGVYSGLVHVQLGGERGVVVDLSAGDVVVIPAGVAHKNIGASDDFHVVGAYPTGTSPDLRYGKPGERPASDRTIATLALPGDPVGGALPAHWRRGA